MAIADYVTRLKLDASGATKSLDKFDKKAVKTAQKTEKGFSKLGRSINKKLAGFAVGGAIVGGFSSLVKVAAELEQGFNSVRKTTGLSKDEIGKLKRELLDFSKTTPVSVTALTDIATVAGQLGIEGVSKIADFTKVFAQLEIASDNTISGEFGAQAFAKFLDQSGAGVEKARQLASAFTVLGNKSKLTEGQLLSMASELTRSTIGSGLTAEALAGISAALIEVGGKPEEAGTSIKKLFDAVAKAVKTGKGMEQFLEITGLTADEFKRLNKDSPEKVLISISKGLDGIIKSGTGKEFELLKSLRLNGDRVGKTLKSLANSHLNLKEKIDLSNAASKEGTALSVEAQTASEVFTKQVQILKNTFVDLADAIAGTGLLTFLSNAVKFTAEIVTNLSQAISNAKALSADGAITSSEKGLSKSDRAIRNRNASNIGGSISEKGLQDLISRNAQVLNNGNFIQKIADRGLLNDGVSAQIRSLRANAATKANGQSASGQTTNNINVNAPVSAIAPNAAQAANTILNTTQQALQVAHGS